MSRIHEALKRAEREKARRPAQEAAVEPASTAATVVTPAAAAPAAPAVIAAAAVATQAAPVPLPRDVAPSVLESCRRSHWQGDASKLFFLNSKNPTFATEQLRTLRSRLYQVRERRHLKTVLVTSAMPSEGKTFICANLAHAFARQHERRVLLVDCDLRASRLHALLGAPGEPGLTAYLKGEATVEQILQRGPLENLFLIPGGRAAVNPGELVARGKLKLLLEQLAPLFDWILLDSPAAAPFSDALTIAAWCDGVLLVVQGGKTTSDMAQGAAQQFREKGLLGVVLNRTGPASAGASYSANTYRRRPAPALFQVHHCSLAREPYQPIG